MIAKSTFSRKTGSITRLSISRSSSGWGLRVARAIVNSFGTDRACDGAIWHNGHCPWLSEDGWSRAVLDVTVRDKQRLRGRVIRTRISGRGVAGPGVPLFRPLANWDDLKSLGKHRAIKNSAA